MGNRFRRLVSLVIVICLAGIVYLLIRATAGVAGIGLLLLKQAVFVFGAVALILYVLRRVGRRH